MTVFQVTNLNDSGAGSLRQAIADAETTAGADTITFDAGLSGGTITLSSNYTINSSDGLTIDGDLNNDGVTDITLSGDANGSGFNDLGDTDILVVGTGANVDINGIRFDGGRARGGIGGPGQNGLNAGGAITNSGALTLLDVDFTRNEGFGGDARNSVLFGIDGGNGGAGAGAILNNANLTLIDVGFSFNEGHGGDGGDGASGRNGTFGSENGGHGGDGGDAGHAAGGVLNFGSLFMVGTIFRFGLADGSLSGRGGDGGDGFTGSNSNGGDGGDAGTHGLLSTSIVNFGSMGGQSLLADSGGWNHGSPSISAGGAAGGNGTAGSAGGSGVPPILDPHNHVSGPPLGPVDNSDRVLGAAIVNLTSGGNGNDILIGDAYAGLSKTYFANVPLVTSYDQHHRFNDSFDTATNFSRFVFGYELNPNVENSEYDGHFVVNRVEGANQEDFWQFEVFQRGQVILDIDNTPTASLDTVLTLYTEDGLEITSNNDVLTLGPSDPGSEGTILDSKIDIFLEAGVYVVRVQDLQDSIIATNESYELNITLPGYLLGFQTPLTGDDDNLDGGAGDDKLYGQIGDDTLWGRNGDDILVGGSGGDAFEGGAGFDLASYEDATVRVVANLNDQTQNTGDAAGDIYDSIEGLIGSDFGDELIGKHSRDNYIHGGDGFDTIYGLSGNDVLIGGAGNDILVGGAGFDDLYGGNGIDFASYQDASFGVSASLEASFFNAGDATGDTYHSIENLRGSNHGDLLAGDEFSNQISGLDGNDELYGREGNDFLFGGEGRDELHGEEGADFMLGGDGNDIYYVDDAGDTVSEFADQGYDIVHATGVANFTLGANVERIIFDDTIDHVAKGNALDNRLNGNAGKDKFLIDEGGADIFSGGSSRDVFDARASTTGIKVYLNNEGANAGATAGDIFRSIEVFSGSSTAGDTMRAGAGRSRFAGNGGDDILIGNNNIDFLQGGADNDTIYGGSGRDTLQGGSGDDLLDGGNARDQFLYVLEGFGHDTIVDFQDGLDYFKVWSGNNPSNGVADDISDFTITGNGTNTVTVTLNSDPTSIITVNSFDGNAMTIDAGDFQFY